MLPPGVIQSAGIDIETEFVDKLQDERFASEFLRGDRIIMRPQWRRSARWKDDAPGATSLLQTAEKLNRTVRWRDAFFPELCGSVTFGCGIGANAAQSAFIAPCFRGVGL